MSALWAHSHLLTSIKIQVQHAVDSMVSSMKLQVQQAVDALETALMNRLTGHIDLHNAVVIEALEDSRRINGQNQILIGVLTGMRIQLDEMAKLVQSERQRRIDAQRSFEARLLQMETASQN